MIYCFPGHKAPVGEGRKSVKTDAHGKPQGLALLRMESNLPGAT